MGRLFDAVSSLLGVRQTVSYEAQAAIELETMAAPYLGAAPRYRFTVSGPDIEPAGLLRAMVDDVRAGCPSGAVAAGFHQAVAALVAEVAEREAGDSGTDRVALSGGVFQNVLLVRLVCAELGRLHLRALVHRVVPPNDGGLGLGQAAVAAARYLLPPKREVVV